MDVKKISLAAVLGGLTLFIWGSVSHMAIPFYNSTLKKFTNEDVVTRAIAANAPHSGTYLLPNYPTHPEGASEAEKNALDEKMNLQMQGGPFVFAHIRVGSMGSMGGYLATELLTNIMAALFVTLLITNAAVSSLRNRVLFAVGVALVMVFDHSASTWNWYYAGTDFFLAESFDAIVGWALAGIVIGMVLGKQG